MVPETLKTLCITTRFHGKTLFAAKIEEMDQRSPKIESFEFEEKFKTVFILY